MRGRQVETAAASPPDRSPACADRTSAGGLRPAGCIVRTAVRRDIKRINRIELRVDTEIHCFQGAYQMPRAKRRKPYNPAKAHDRRSRDLLRNAEVATVAVDNPLALEPGEKIVALRSIRNDPLARLHSHRQIDEAQYQAGRAFQGEGGARPTRGRSEPGTCRWRAATRADHRGSTQGRAAVEPCRARTWGGRLGAGA